MKSPKYKDGLTQPCKDCRRSAMAERLASNPTCSKCGERPHQPKHPYCYECQRDSKGYTKPPKFRRDSNNELCSRCKESPRARGKNYCTKCANEYMRNWLSERGGSWAVKTPEQRRLATVRHYAHWLVSSGKVSRTLCVFCGAPGNEFHHYDYEPRTRNFESVCTQCQGDAHRFLNSVLTIMRRGYRFPSSSFAMTPAE